MPVYCSRILIVSSIVCLEIIDLNHISLFGAMASGTHSEDLMVFKEINMFTCLNFFLFFSFQDTC